MKKGICLIGIVIPILLLVSCGKDNASFNDSSSHESFTTESTEIIPNVYKVTFINYDNSSYVINVNEGESIDNPGNDKTIEGQRVKFYGWYLNNEPYDFNLPINNDITLKSYCVSYDDIDTEIRWVFSNNIETSDVVVERDASLLSLNNNEYFGFIKNKEGIKHFKYGDKYIISKPFKELKTAISSDSFNVYDNDNLIATVKEGDEIEVDGNYTIVVNINPKTISSSIDGVDNGSVDITRDYVIPEYDFSKLGDSQRFIGYILDNDYRLYQPNEILISDELQDFDSLDFRSMIIDISSAYHVASIEDFTNLLSEDLTDENTIVSLDADLDFNNEDLGPGIEEFNGTLLGNNHTISNASIDKNDEDMGNSGFIQYTQYGCNIFDLNFRNIDSYACSVYGQGIVIGEADSFVNVCNVNVDGVEFKACDFNKYGTVINGISGFIGTMGTGNIINCEIKNISLIGDREFFKEPWKIEATKNYVDITFGGMIGRTFGMDSDKYFGLSIKQCSLDSIGCQIEGMNAISVGGLGGYIECSYNGVWIVNNEIKNIDLEVKNWQKKENKESVINVGGMFGYFEDYTLYVNEDGDYVKANVVAKNILDNVDLKIGSTNEPKIISSMSIYSGLFTGDYNVSLGNNYNPTKKGHSKFNNNSFKGNITIDTYKEDAKVYSGGISGSFYQETKGRSTYFLENNEIDVDLLVKGDIINSSHAGGLFGYCGNGERDGSLFKHNVIKGNLENDNEEYKAIRTTDPILSNGGLIGLLLNADGYVELSENVVLLNTELDVEYYASFVFYAVNDAYGDSNMAEMDIKDNIISSISSKGADLKDVRHYEVDEYTLNNYHLSNEYWKMDEKLTPTHL